MFESDDDMQEAEIPETEDGVAKVQTDYTMAQKPPEIVVTKVNGSSAFRLNSEMYKAKVLVLGPCQSGKSVISNFLSDATDTAAGEYHPTQAVRILEFEANNIAVGGRNVTAEVELWDVSGDQKFEACWPAIARDTNGVVFVFNPDQPNHDKELENWYNNFVENQALRSSQCIALAHKKTASVDSLPAGPLQNIKVVPTNIEEEGEALRAEFNNFLAGLLSALSDKREQEELSIMNNR